MYDREYGDCTLVQVLNMFYGLKKGAKFQIYEKKEYRAVRSGSLTS